jgi:hypothetical protein
MTLRTKVALSMLLALMIAGLAGLGYRRFIVTTGSAASAVQRPRSVTAVAPARAIATTTPSSDVDLVKNGRLPEYSARTVGNAFESRFEAARWESAVTLEGQKAVEFHGTVKYTVLKQAGFYIGTWNGVRQGIDTEKLISDYKHRCSAEAGITQTAMFDEAIIEPCMAKAYQKIVVPITFQFIIASDNKTVEMTLPDPVFQRFDPDHRLREYRAATLAFIYQ